MFPVPSSGFLVRVRRSGSLFEVLSSRFWLPQFWEPQPRTRNVEPGTGNGSLIPGSNFADRIYVETHVFRPRYRHGRFAEPLNWTDYRWDAGPWGMGSAAHRWRDGARSWAHGSRRRTHPFLLLLIAGVAALLGARLLSSLQSRNTSWARRGLYAAILLLIIGAFSRNRRSGWY